MSKLGRILFFLAFISLASFGVVRLLVGEFIPFLWIPIGLTPLFILMSIFVDRKFYGEFLSMKTTRQGMSMGGMILIVLVALSAANVIAVRKYSVFDFSLAQVNTLSEQSVKLLKSLDSDLSIKYFYQKGQEHIEENRRQFRELAKKYQDVSSRVHLDFIEVNERPDLAEQYGVNKGSGVVFLDYKGHRNRIDKIDEQEMTGALVKVTREKDKTLYFVTGHGEAGLDDTKEAGGLNRLKLMLEGNRYIAKPLSLVVFEKVPADADAVFVVGPQQAFLANEVKALEEYLKNGGSLVLALDSKRLHGLDSLIGELGVEAHNDFVVTVFDSAFGKAIDPAKTPASVFSSTNPITKVFGQDQFVVMRMPQSFAKKSNASPNITYEDIVKTNEKSLSFNSADFHGESKKGPFSVGLALKGKLEGATKEFNAVVLGSSSLFGNQLLFHNLNRDLVLNSAAYLSKEENLISITPKEVGVTQLNLSPTLFYLFVFGVVIPLPLLLMGWSGFLWFRRRSA